MPMKLPTLSALRCFEAAARRGSMTEAAKELGLTQTAISRGVQRLEQDLGYALFHRSHRAISLTDQGARYAQCVSEGFRQFTDFEDNKEHIRTSISIEAEGTFFRQWLLPRLREQSFTEMNISVTVHTHEDHPRVIPASADLAITRSFADYNGFKRTRLVSPQTVLVAHPALGLTQLSDAVEHCLIHGQDEDWWRIVFSTAGIPYPERAKSLTLQRCDLPIQAACIGLGVAVGSDVIAEQELKSGLLEAIPGPRLGSQDYYLLSRTTTSVPARKVAAWIISQADEFKVWQQYFFANTAQEFQSKFSSVAANMNA